MTPSDAGREVARKLAEVALDDDRVAGDVCDLRVGRRGGVLARARDLAPDPQLLRLEAEREDEADVLADRGVRRAAQAAEHDDVAGRADFGARIDVAEDEQMAF